MDCHRFRHCVKEIKLPDDMKARITDRALAASSTARTGRGRRILRTCAAAALAAALAFSMAAAAFAAVSSDWLAAFFTDNAGAALTAKQYRFLEEQSVAIGQSITAEGYTVTVERAICDAQNLFLVIRVAGPEGVALDPPPDDGSCFFDYAKCESTGTYNRTGSLIVATGSWRTLDDGDDKAHTVTFLHTKQQVMSPDSNQVYTDGACWRLQLADLTIRSGAPSYEKTVLAAGGWSFEFPLTEISTQAELISSPVFCTAQAGGEAGQRESVELMVTSFVLTPFGALCSYSFLPGCRPESVDILTVSLLMKDGTVVTARPRSGGGAGAIGSNGDVMSYTFDAPVMLDEVAFLVLPEDVRIPFSGAQK